MKKNLKEKLIDGNLEIFIQYQASTIFYYNLSEPDSQPRVDLQLISGFLNATVLFFDNLGYPKDSNLFRIIRGSTELRMHIGDDIHGTLVLLGLQNLSDLAYKELDEMMKSLIEQFRQKYTKEIELFINEGYMDFKGIDKFILNQVMKMRAHIFSSYLMRVLGLCINSNVRRKDSIKALSSINKIFAEEEDFAVICDRLNLFRDKIIEWSKRHVSVRRIILRVNKESAEVWRLFTIPIIDNIKI